MAIFSATGQTPRYWGWMARHGSDIYANAQFSIGFSEDVIYKQTGGVGSFNALTMTPGFYQGMAVVGNDLYVTDSTGVLTGTSGVCKLTNMTGVWSLHEASIYYSLTSYGNDLYGIYNHNVYKQTNCTGSFVQISTNNMDYQAIAVNPVNGDVYAVSSGTAFSPASNGDIYVQTGGIGSFNALGETLRLWKGICCYGGNVYACVTDGDIYEQAGGTGPFVAMSEGNKKWSALLAASNGIYATDRGAYFIYGDIYYAPIVVPVPTITSISPSTSIQSGNTIKIYGTDLQGLSTTVLLINSVDYSTKIISSSSTLITFVAPSLADGSYDLEIVADSVSTGMYSISYSTPFTRYDELPAESNPDGTLKYQGPRDILMSSDGDILISSVTKDLLLSRNQKEYVSQAIKQRIRTFLGEYFLDTTIGIPYHQKVFTKGGDLRILQTLIVEQITSVPGVKELTFYSNSLDKTTRTLNITFEAILDNNEVITTTESV